MNITHMPAQYFLKGTGINEQTFYQRVILRKIKFITPFNGDKLYSVEDWNEKCPDRKLTLDTDEK